MIYVKVGPSPSARKGLEDFLEGKGFEVNRKYWPEGGTVEVRVAYFKGHHWKE